MSRRRTSPATVDWPALEQQILDRIDIPAEVRSWSVRVAASHPSATGWMACYSVDRDEQNPSAAFSTTTGKYKDLGAADSKPVSFWEFAKLANNGRFSTWQDARSHYASVAGVTLPSAGGERNGSANRDPMADVEVIDNELLVRLGFKNFCKAKSGLDADAARHRSGAKIVRWEKADKPHCVALFAHRGGRLVRVVIYRCDGREFTHPEPKHRVHCCAGGDGEGVITFGGPESFSAAETVVFTEGPSDMLAVGTLLPAGYAAVTNSYGANSDVATVAAEFAGKIVWVVGDADEAGQAGATAKAGVLARHAKEVRLLALPFAIEKKHGQDARDWVAGGATFHDLRQLAEAAAVVEPTDPASDAGGRGRRRGKGPSSSAGRPAASGKPEVDIGGGLHQAGNRLWNALAEADATDPKLFARDGQAVRLVPTDDGGLKVQPLTRESLRLEIVERVQCVSVGGDGDDSPTDPPLTLCAHLLAFSNPPLPKLARITSAPQFAPDGSIRLDAGYDAKTATFFHPPASLALPPVPDRPTAADLERARNLWLGEVLVDFPLVGRADVANIMALVVQLFVRNLIAGPTPLYLINKPEIGSGATLMAKAVYLAATGRDLAINAEIQVEDEWRKTISSQLLESPDAVLFDNCNRIKSPSLAAVLTSSVWSYRTLGMTQQVSVPATAAWIATGNNPSLSSEITRRAVSIRLDAKIPEPWTRKDFRNPNILQWVRDHRGDLVWAILTIVRAWFAAGQPKSTAVRLGSYEQWSEIIGGILTVAGVDGFLDNSRVLFDSLDREGVADRMFLGEWYAEAGEEPVLAKDLLGLAEPHLNINGADEPSKCRSLGKLLSAREGRVYRLRVEEFSAAGFVDVRIERAGALKRSITWKLTILPNDDETSTLPPTATPAENRETANGYSQVSLLTENGQTHPTLTGKLTDVSDIQDNNLHPTGEFSEFRNDIIRVCARTHAPAPAPEETASCQNQLTKLVNSPPEPWPCEAAEFVSQLTSANFPIPPFSWPVGAATIPSADALDRTLASLRRDIEAGPSGPRARYGSLQKELIAVWKLCGGEIAISVPSHSETAAAST